MIRDMDAAPLAIVDPSSGPRLHLAVENHSMQTFREILAASDGTKGEVVGVAPSPWRLKQAEDRGADRQPVRRDGGVTAGWAGRAGCALCTARTACALRSGMASRSPQPPRSLRACLAILSVPAIGPLRPRGLLDLRKLLLNAGGKA